MEGIWRVKSFFSTSARGDRFSRWSGMHGDKPSKVHHKFLGVRWFSWVPFPIVEADMVDSKKRSLRWAPSGRPNRKTSLPCPSSKLHTWSATKPWEQHDPRIMIESNMHFQGFQQYMLSMERSGRWTGWTLKESSTCVHITKQSRSYLRKCSYMEWKDLSYNSIGKK